MARDLTSAPLPPRPAQLYPDQTPPAGSLAGAAFRQENPVVAFMKLANRPAFEPQADFDLKAKSKDAQVLFENYREHFLGTVSNEDFDYRVANLEEELADRRRIEAGGITGVLAMMAAGVLSPTTILPIVGLSVNASRAARAGAVALNAAGAVAIDEAVLREANVTRTDLETALTVGGAAVLGGALGALLPSIAPAVRAKALKQIEDIVHNPDRRITDEEAAELVREYVGPSSLGAMSTDTVQYAGPYADLTSPGRLLGGISPLVAPILRQMDSEYPLDYGAAMVQQFSTGGLRATTPPDPNSALGLRIPVAEGGGLEGRIRMQERVFQDKAQDIALLAWIKHEEISPGPFLRARAEAVSILSGTRFSRTRPGKLTWTEFNEELHRALNMGDESAYPEIAEAAREYRRQILDPLTREMQRVGLLPEELTEDMLKGSLSYFMRVYDHDMLARHPNAMIEILFQHSRAKRLEMLQNRWAKAVEEDRADLQAVADRTLPGDEAAQARQAVTEELEGLRSDPQAQVLAEEARLRREQRELNARIKAIREDPKGDPSNALALEKEAQRLAEEAKRLKEQNPDTKEFKARQKALEKRRKNLGRTLDKLIGKQGEAVERADKLTHLMDDQLFRAVPRIRKLIDDLDRMTDEAFDEAAGRLADEFTKLEQRLAQGEELLEGLARRYPELVDAPAEWTARVQRFKEDVFAHLGEGREATQPYSFSGRLSTYHGFPESDVGPNGLPLFAMPDDARYGGAFGDGNRVYLDPDGSWARGEAGMLFQQIADADVEFKNALVITPENVRKVLELSGQRSAKAAREKMNAEYDALYETYSERVRPLADRRNATRDDAEYTRISTQMGEIYDEIFEEFNAKYSEELRATLAYSNYGFKLGVDLADWAESAGYDGLIIRGFGSSGDNQLVPGLETGFFQDQIVAFNKNAVKPTGLATERAFGGEVPAGLAAIDARIQQASGAGPIERGPKGEKILRIDSEESKKAAIDAIDAVLDEGEIKRLVGDEIEFTELTAAQRKSLETWRDDISKLRWSDEAALRKAEERFDREIGRQLSRQDRFDTTFERLREADTLDRDALRDAAFARIEDLTRKTRENLSKRAVREAQLRKKASQIGMEDIPRFVEETERLRARPGERRDKFLEWARTKGFADEVDYATGEFNIDGPLRAQAANLVSRLQGNYVSTPVDGDLLTHTNGPTLARLLDIPYEQKFQTPEGEFAISDFLVKDVVPTLHAYIRTVIPDVELTARFGSPSAKRYLETAKGPDTSDGLLRQRYFLRVEQIANDLDADGKPLAKPRTAEEKARLTQKVKRDLDLSQKELQTVIERMRHRHGVPEDPSSLYVRTLRTFRLAMVPLFMGNVLFASIPEIGKVPFRYGMTNTFNDSWSRFATDLQGVMKQVNEMYKAGQGLDPKNSSRLMAMSDINESVLRHSAFEQIIEFFSRKTGAVSLFDRGTQALKMLAAPVAMGKFWRAMEKVMDPETLEKTVRGFDREEALQLLANAGVGEKQARALWALVNEHGFERTSSGFIWPNFDAWAATPDGLEMLNLWRGWLGQELDTVIVVPGLERPMWTTGSEEARVVNLFRSFMWGSNTKTLLSGVQQRDAAVAQGTMLMLALGYVSYAAWAAQHGPGTQQWEDFLDASPGRIMDEAIYRSGLLAAVGEGKDILAEIPALRGYLTFSETGPARLRDPDLFEAAMGVSMTAMNRMWRLLGGMADPTQATTSAARQLTFYNNVWYMRRAMMEVEKGFAEAVGIPERRN